MSEIKDQKRYQELYSANAQSKEGSNVAFLSEEDYLFYLETLRKGRVKQLWKHLQILPREQQFEEICEEMELLEALMARLNGKQCH